MHQPELYRRYTRAEAVSVFGASMTSARAAGDWVVFPHIALCFATLGTEPGESRFHTAGGFWWVPQHAGGVGPDGFPSVPREVRGNYKPKMPIWLFARWLGSQDYTCLGSLDQTYASGGPHNDLWFGYAEFRLTPAVPWRLLREITRSDFVVGDWRSADAAVGRLRGVTTPRERFAILQTLVEYWRGPVAASDGIADDALAGFEMPDVLRWWYRWAGSRERILAGQNFLLGPDELRIEPDDRLIFARENQGCCHWATLREGEDPPVFMRENSPGARWQTERIRLSEHLIMACLFEATIAVPYGATTVGVKPEALQAITEIVPPIALPPWLWFSTRLHQAGGIVMSVMGDQGGGCLWIGSHTEEPLQALRPYIDEDWEYVSL